MNEPQLLPTDSEIVALMRDGNNCNYNDEAEHIDFARAVLAKWGTPPAVVGEPVALLVRKKSWPEGQWDCAPKGFPDYGRQWTDERIWVYTHPSPPEGMVADLKTRLLTALERAGAAESLLRNLVDECDNDSIVGWEERMATCIDSANRFLSSPSPPEGMAGWTTLPGQLPEPGMPVLLDIGKKFPIRAVWVAKHTVPAHDEADGDWVEYDEATDEVYCPEGWYEWNEHEETHWSVNAAPVAWCELPPLASEAKGAGHADQA